MEPIEELFATYLPKYTAALHNSIFEKDGGKLDEKYYQKTHHSFVKCFVGHMRMMLGLPEYFASSRGEDKKDYCHICYLVAVDIARCERFKKKDKYLYTLKNFKVHLKKEHLIDIERHARIT